MMRRLTTSYKGNTSKRPRRKTELNEEALQELIRQRAYHLHQQRGREHGKDLDDWLEAERMIKAQLRKK